MKKDFIIEIYCEDNLLIVKDTQKNTVQLVNNSDSLTIKDCLEILKKEKKNVDNLLVVY